MEPIGGLPKLIEVPNPEVRQFCVTSIIEQIRASRGTRFNLYMCSPSTSLWFSEASISSRENLTGQQMRAVVLDQNLMKIITPFK